jgi:squalene-hopene/tetraprenyl-beta-curcumene cyclase
MADAQKIWEVRAGIQASSEEYSEIEDSLNSSDEDQLPCIDMAAAWLLDQQDAEGFWVGNVESNACIEAEWLLASHILGWALPDKARIVRGLLERQRSDGSWAVYPGASDGDINSTVEVYAALSASGMDCNSICLSNARRWIKGRGGLGHIRVFTRYWLALLGVWPWEATPNLPPEIVRLPRMVPFNIYNFAQWARATLVPLAVLSARRPVYPLPQGNRLAELFEGDDRSRVVASAVEESRRFSLEWLFQKLDRALHIVQNNHLFLFREESIKLCLEWILRHQDEDGSWGGIQPPWIYGLLALKGEGFSLSHPVLAKATSAVSKHWSFTRKNATYIQATESSVWDTLLSLLAMYECFPDQNISPQMERALSWILDRQSVVYGDWQIKIGNVAPGGWAFERANNFYPDIDDTALALLVLARLRNLSGSLGARIEAAIGRGVEWTLAMQSSNGGWGAFDKDNDKQLISRIAFCKFGEALDPPSADVTGHVLEAFGALGMTNALPSIRKALEFLRKEQEQEGSWFGRWGVNHIYGTAAVLPGLRAVGEDMSQPYIRQAAGWIASKQHADGGWGETCASYMDSSMRGMGDNTPSQTAWALMALLAVDFEEMQPALIKGRQYLEKTQMQDGTWEEKSYTATGFPGYGVGARTNLDEKELRDRLQQGTELSRGFMLSFNLYRHYFPMIALGRFRQRLGEDGSREFDF